MTKIVFLGAGLLSGGAEHQCAQLMDMLVAKGYDVTYVSFGQEKDHYSISPLVHRVNICNDRNLIIKVLAVELHLLLLKADIFFAFSQQTSVLSLFPLLFRPSIKVISSERNFTFKNPDKFEKILINTGIYKRANYIVPNNYSQGKYLAAKYPWLKEKIHVITNFTDLDTYGSTPVPNNDIIKLGIFCRFEFQKNFHRFIDAINLIVKRMPEIEFHIDWYGNHKFSNDKQISYFEDGIKKIKEYKLESFISIFSPTHEVAKLIPNYDVLCLPSLYEGFSNSISEYICCGRPVICSDVSDNSVMVHDGENGFLFDPLNVEDIYLAFYRYFKCSKEQKTLMGNCSRKIAESLFNKEKFIQSYINLIET